MTSAERHLCSYCFPLVAAWQFATGTCGGHAGDGQRLASNSGIHRPDRVTGLHHGTEFGDAR